MRCANSLALVFRRRAIADVLYFRRTETRQKKASVQSRRSEAQLDSEAGRPLAQIEGGMALRERKKETNTEEEVVEEMMSSPRTPSGRAGRLWQKVKDRYQLVDFHALPEYLRDNEFILKHYRSNWPMKDILYSIFTIHNETLNIWTHLIGFLLFLCLTIYTAAMLPKVDMHNFPSRLPNMDDLHKLQSELVTCLHSMHLPEVVSNCLPGSFSAANSTNQCVLRTMKDDVVNLMAPLLPQPTTRWPFFIFLGGAMFCLLSSTTCHLLSCHSERASYILLRLDYAGIASLIAASFYPPVYYSFMCNPILRNMYLTGITAIGVATVLVSLIPVFQTPQYRKFRAIVFFCMGVSGVIPCVHKVLVHGDEPAAINTLMYEALMGLFYGLGAIIYVTRIPERWKPGHFDIAGHSHQLFHVLVVAGAFTHYKAGLLYLKWRDVQGCP